MPCLELTIVSCTGLSNVESLGTIDPFCTVQFEGKGYATDPCPNTLNPIWDKTFRFNVADAESSQAHICVWNKNLIKDDFLGDYWLSVDGLVRGCPEGRKVLLTKCKGNCELQIIIKAIDFGAGPIVEGCYASDPPLADKVTDVPFNPPPRQPSQDGAATFAASGGLPPSSSLQGHPLPRVPAPTGRVGIRSAFGTHLHGSKIGVSTTPNLDAWETWMVESIDGKYILNSHDDWFLHADPKLTVKTVPHCQDWEKWTIESHPTLAGKFIIRSYHGSFLRAERGSSAVTLGVSLSEEGGEAWELFPRSGPGIDLRLTAGQVVIRSFHDTHLQGNGGKIKTSPNMKEWETWSVKPLGGGKYALSPHDGGYLRADPKLTVNTAPHCQDWEKWTIEGHPTVPNRAVIRSHHGTYLRADNSSSTVNLAAKPLEWEAWDVIPVSEFDNLMHLRRQDGVHAM